MSQNHEPRRAVSIGPEDVLETARQRLGTALHQLARDLARERRRNAELEREVARLRTKTQPPGDRP
jgi:hypothetical protein